MHNNSESLGSERIAKLLVRLSAPAMVGLLVQALYNLTDTIFVGRGIGTLGIAGIAIALPVQLVVMAIAMMLGIGSASIVSRSLGAGDRARANRTLGNLFTLILGLSFLITVVGSLFIGSLVKLFGATESILPYSVDYLRIILIGTVFFMFAMATNAVVRAEGNAKVAMWTMLISAGLNIVLDPLFIFGLHMGIRGAALATVLAQATTVIYLVFYFLGGRSGLRARFRDLVLDRRITVEIFTVGGASFARQAAGSILVIVLNKTLALHGGDIAIAAFGILNRLFMFLFLPMFGIVQGLQPIVGFNYGARRGDRARQAVRLASIATTVISTAAFVLMMVIPGPLLEVFSKDRQLIALGIPATRIIVLAFPTIGFQVVTAGMYQALGHAIPAIILALLRQVILLVPLVLILPQFLNLAGVWAAFPIADGMAAAVTAFMLAKAMCKLHDRTQIGTEELQPAVE